MCRLDRNQIYGKQTHTHTKNERGRIKWKTQDDHADNKTARAFQTNQKTTKNEYFNVKPHSSLLFIHVVCFSCENISDFLYLNRKKFSNLYFFCTKNAKKMNEQRSKFWDVCDFGEREREKKMLEETKVAVIYFNLSQWQSLIHLAFCGFRTLSEK